jgi:hypothetical protein
MPKTRLGSRIARLVDHDLYAAGQVRMNGYAEALVFWGFVRPNTVVTPRRNRRSNIVTHESDLVWRAFLGRAGLHSFFANESPYTA